MADDIIEKNNRDPSSISAFKSDIIVSEAYQKYDQGLRIFLSRKLGSIDDIDDVVQEVYLRIIKHCRQKDAELTFAYLCTVALNVVKDQLRKQHIRAVSLHVSLDEVELRTSAQSPEQVLRSKEGIAVIKDAFRSLDKKSRKAITLHRFNGLTYEAIGKQMGISISMVRKHIIKALHHISKKIETYHENI